MTIANLCALCDMAEAVEVGVSVAGTAALGIQLGAGGLEDSARVLKHVLVKDILDGGAYLDGIIEHPVVDELTKEMVRINTDHHHHQGTDRVEADVAAHRQAARHAVGVVRLDGTKRTCGRMRLTILAISMVRPPPPTGTKTGSRQPN